MEIFIGALIGFVIGTVGLAFADWFQVKKMRAQKEFAEARYESLKGFFDARVLAVKAKADEAKKRA